MNESLDLAHFWAHADGVARLVLAILLASSVTTWYLIVTKALRQVQTSRRSSHFLRRFWDAPNLEAVAQHMGTQGADNPFSHLLHHGFTAIEQISRNDTGHSLVSAGEPADRLTRALRRAIEEDKARMAFGQTTLATVASSGPFVGLFGTVWGIYHALAAIGLSGQTSLDKVAGPVGEALVMTGIGLAVAIPAAVAYNAFARSNHDTLARLNSFAYDVFNLLAHGVKASPQQTDVRAASDVVIALARAQAASR